MRRWLAPLLALAVVGLATGGAPSQGKGGFRHQPEAMVRLGRLLFYDRVLSANYRIACATCHHHDRASSNGFAIAAVREPVRDAVAVEGLAPWERFAPSPRHAPALFNLGAREFDTLFVDGRVAAHGRNPVPPPAAALRPSARSGDGRFHSPAGAILPGGLRDVLAVQALFPTIAAGELGGRVDELGRPLAPRTTVQTWSGMVERVRAVEGYAPLFRAAFPDVEAGGEIEVAHIANALSAFVGSEWRADASPFDRWLAGDAAAATEDARAGRRLFDDLGCARCHAGRFQTDHQFHVVATPFWRFDTDELADAAGIEPGRFAVTADEADRYAMRTPSLRNVLHTAPYGHAGSHRDLRRFLRDHADPAAGMERWLAGRRVAPTARAAFADAVSRSAIVPRALDDAQLDRLLAFLATLTDEGSLKGRLGKPAAVPSNLALD